MGFTEKEVKRDVMILGQCVGRDPQSTGPRFQASSAPLGSPGPDALRWTHVMAEELRFWLFHRALKGARLRVYSIIIFSHIPGISFQITSVNREISLVPSHNDWVNISLFCFWNVKKLQHYRELWYTILVFVFSLFCTSFFGDNYV